MSVSVRKSFGFAIIATAAALLVSACIPNPGPSTPNTLSITTFEVPVGRIGQAFDTQLAATGNAGALTWSVVSGVLPPGLSLSSSGEISGTVTELAGPSRKVRVKATDTATGHSRTRLLAFLFTEQSAGWSGAALPDGSSIEVVTLPNYPDCGASCKPTLGRYMADGSFVPYEVMSVEIAGRYGGDQDAMSPDGSTLIQNGLAIDADTGATLAQLLPQSEPIDYSRAYFAPDGSSVIVLYGNIATVFDTSTWNTIGDVDPAYGTPVWSADSTEFIVNTYESSEPVVVHSTTGDVVRSFERPGSCSIRDWSASDRLLLECNGSVKTADATDGSAVRNLMETTCGTGFPCDRFSGTTFSPSGDYVLGTKTEWLSALPQNGDTQLYLAADHDNSMPSVLADAPGTTLMQGAGWR